MSAITKQKANPVELYEQNKNGELTRTAIEQGLTLSAFLEDIDPTESYGNEEMLDAFGRQLAVAGIRTVSNPAAGIWADEFGAFDRDGNRSLAYEWCARRWREVKFNQPANPRAHVSVNQHGTRSVYTSADEALNTFFRPYTDTGSVRDTTRVANTVTLDRLVAVTTPISGDAYRAAYMTDPTASDIRFVRVAELGEIPLAKITAGEQSIRLHKYGRGFEMSYEAMRRTRIDKVAFWLQRVALQQEVDKVDHAISVLLNGDGNANSATVHNQTVLHPSSPAGTLTLQAWIAFKEAWGDAYSMDLALMRADTKVELLLLDIGPDQLAFTLTELFGSLNPSNGRMTDAVEIARYSGAAADTIIGIDTTSALEHVVEIGSEISETTKFVTRQSDVIVMTETEGFAVLDKNATRVLNIAA